MADNVVAAPGSGGATFRTLDDGVAEWPANVAAYATTVAPGANVLQVVTPSAGLPVAQQGAWNIAAISGTVSLPTGASTAALQTTGNTSVASIDAKTPALGQALAAASVPVVLTAAQLTTLTPLATVAISNTSFIATQATPANLQVSATQVVGSAATRWFSQLSDGTNSPAIKAASTASAFTDPALAVSVRPGELFGSTAALADATANPTERRDAADNFLFNGTTWDRQRGMSVATTTGDTGAKVATGNGATITNVGNKGLQVVLAMGVVSGTTPTFVMKLQGSVDGGTNFYDIPGATTASLVATGVWGITIYPGIVATAGTTTSGSTATVSMVVPRTWRVVWTIGGTTPSFTITSITYNYLPN